MGTKGWSFVGASMEDERGEESYVRERERASEMLGLSEERESCFLV